VNTYLVDLDYESFLFDPDSSRNDSKNQRAIKEFEYVFFIVNKERCNLKNINNYSADYLTQLKKMEFVLPELTPKATNAICWWGNRSNLDLERKLNSKITSAELGKHHGWGFHEGAIVQNYEELREHIKNMPYKSYILKSPFSFSGIGHTVFLKDQVPLIQFNGPMLLEPKYDRICDLGITFEVMNLELKRMFIVENFNNKLGSFKGGMGCTDQAKFFQEIKRKYTFDLETNLEIYTKIFHAYKNLGAISNIQIDSFIYRDELTGEIKLYPLVEVNYRKTMGLVIYSLAEKYPGKLIEWRVTHTSEYEKLSDWIKISPTGNKFNSYFKVFD
jgi:hypothetical protein